MIRYDRRMFPESRKFQLLRYGTGSIVVLLYLIYLAYLVVQVANDKKLIQVSYDYVDKLRIPNVEICGDWSDIEISRCVFTWNNSSSTEYASCSEFLTQKKIDYDEHKYCYNYGTNNDTYFGNNGMALPGPWVKGIDFYFKIINITNVTSQFLSVGTVTVKLMDPELKMDLANPVDKRIDQELKLVNGFAGIQNTSVVVTFRKSTFQSIKPRDISAIFGGNPNYHNTTYLTTESKNFLMHPNDSFTDTGHFNIAPASFYVEVKSEKCSHTIIGMLGLAGGAFGLVAGLYVLLYGRQRNNPWGIMHRVASFESANSSDLQNLPFVSTFDPIQNREIPAGERMERLEIRHLELERILKEYVFNSSALERFVRRNSRG